MFKKIVIGSMLLGLIAVLLAGAVNGTQAKAEVRGVGPVGTPAPAAAPGGNADGQGRGGRQAQGRAPAEAGSGQLPAAAPAGLSQTESEGLLFMYEEEKLARDVYAALYTQWGLTTFQNISASEQAHMDAIAGLLDRYALAIPAPAAPGQFANADLLALYSELVARGSQSLAEALKVGGAIEEIDIQDLDTRQAQTSQAGIQQVYANLRRGSENHLRAFASALQAQTGETYQPQYLSAEAYQALVSSSAGQGQGGSGGGYRRGRP